MRGGAAKGSFKWLAAWTAAIFSGTTALMVVLCIVFQDFLVFPAAANSFLGVYNHKVHPGFESAMLETADGKRIEIWRSETGEASLPAVLFLHGNGNNLHSIRWVLAAIAKQGFKTYAIDYRGFGRSPGWPSEAGLYEDVTAAYRYMVESEMHAPSKIAILAHSLGTAPAAYLAARHEVGALMLAAPFTSIPDVVRTKPWFRHLASFVRSEFPTLAYMKRSRAGCVSIFAARGEQTVPTHLSEEVARAVPGAALRLFDGNHNSVLLDMLKSFAGELSRCADAAPPATS